MTKSRLSLQIRLKTRNADSHKFLDSRFRENDKKISLLVRDEN